MSFERYSGNVDLLRRYPHYNSVEDGVAATELEQSDNATFIVRAPLGCFEFHRCYWQRNEIVTQMDFSITMNEMWRLRRVAARELGEIQLEELNISHKINEL